jgi:UDP-N-acetylmuramoyl-L-alanyl-D-glutamate--2,6-diaminopimelate ligase
LLGEFNLYNLLAVLGVALARKSSARELESINDVRAVAGRLQTFAVPNQPLMVVDYAHTPDALENVLRTLKPLCEGKLLTVFGCGGDRDKGKRKEMGTIARALSSYSVLTSDNPRTEAPDAILSDIESAFTDCDDYICIEDREEAIAHAFELARTGDVILVAGKGHETYQEVNGERRYFSDADCCSRLLGLDQDVERADSEEAKS